MGRVESPGRAAEELPGGEGPSARSDGLARLEAVLFLARQSQASRKLGQLAGLADGTEARTLVRKLNRLYDTEGSAFRVEEVAGGFQLMSRPKFAPWLRRLHRLLVEIRLSAPAMETLAVVAYRQPVLRADIEAIRGVQCGEILRQLIERELVRIVGRSEELGRPFLYGTTRQFLQIFGLRHLEELPRRELLQVAQPRPAGTATAETDQQISHQPNHFDQVEEETKVKTAATADTYPEALPDENAATVVQTPRNEQPDEEHSFDDDEDEGYPDEYDEDECDDEEDDEDEDEDEFEDEPWEEVEEDGEEEDDEDEEDDDDWEDDDEDWDDDEWDDDDEDEDEDEEDEEQSPPSAS